MAKSVFTKILTIFIAVLLISFTITGILLNIGLNRFIADQKAQQLQLGGEKVFQALDQYIQGSYLDMMLFTNFVEAVADNSGSMIWVVRKSDGAVIISSDIPQYVKKSLKTTEDGFPELPDKRQYSMSGTKGNYLSGDFYGLFKDSGVEWVTVYKNFRIVNAAHNVSFDGVILVHSKLPAMNSTRYSILEIFLISGGIASFIALIFVLIFSRRLVKPIAEMKQVARRIASGEFKERIKIRGVDEIADLSRSFNNMVDALENLDNMRRDFLSNVSHELRTPITTIKGFVEGIIDGVIPREKQDAYLSIVRDEVNRMQGLVNDLLDLARMQAGEVKPKMSVFDINELVRRSVISLQQLFEEKNLEFAADFETERIFVSADYDAIQRVMINLLHNAVKFTPEGGRIFVRTSGQEEVSVVVEDTGCGIPNNELPYVFERFYKADKSRGLDKTGVGLGLAIVRNIIVSHHQTIRVESDEGNGSRFIFTLRGADPPEQY